MSMVGKNGHFGKVIAGKFYHFDFWVKEIHKNSGKSDYLAGKNTLFQAVHMSDVMMVNLGSDDWPEKRVMTAAHPGTTFQCDCPRGIY